MDTLPADRKVRSALQCHCPLPLLRGIALGCAGRGVSLYKVGAAARWLSPRALAQLKICPTLRNTTAA